MKPRVLFVDDEPLVLDGLRRMLRPLREECELEFLNTGEEALKRLAEQPAAVVVADMQMPAMNGLELLMKVEEQAPDTVRIMLTGNADQQTAQDAVNRGHIFRFLSKPCPPEELIRALTAGLGQYSLVTAERELLERTLNGGVKMLTDILSMLDPDSFGRGQRLREYVRSLAPTMGLSQTWDLELAAMLSPIGFVTVPPSVLEKVRAGSQLEQSEQEILTHVPQIGADLVSNIPRLESVSRIVLYQAKNFDGTGFPEDSVAGDEIPIGARILHVLQGLLDREKNLHKDRALEEMKQSPDRYDPKVIDAVAATFDIDLKNDAPSDASAVPITFAELKVGEILRADLFTKDGLMLVGADVQISPLLLARLGNFARLSGIAEPIYVDEHSLRRLQGTL